MVPRTIGVASLLALACTATAATESKPKPPENPEYVAWTRHPVGSAVTYQEKTTGDGAGEAKITITVAAITPETVTLETSRSTPPPTTAPATQTARPGKGKQIIKAAAQPGLGNTKVLREGTEDIKVGDTTYKCKWVETRISNTMGAINRITVTKVWTNDSVPGGVVRSVARAEALPALKMAETVITRQLTELKVPQKTKTE